MILFFVNNNWSNLFIKCFLCLSIVETPVSGGEDNMETIVAAEALLNMESPNNILDEKRMSM